MVDGGACSWVGCLAVNLVQCLYAVEHRLLGFVVLGAELWSALKHDVFQIVGKAGGLGWVILAASAHGNGGLDARLVVVHHQIHFKAVIQRVDSHVARVALHALIAVALKGVGIALLGKEVVTQHQQ